MAGSFPILRSLCERIALGQFVLFSVGSISNKRMMASGAKEEHAGKQHRKRPSLPNNQSYSSQENTRQEQGYLAPQCAGNRSEHRCKAQTKDWGKTDP